MLDALRKFFLRYVRKRSGQNRFLPMTNRLWVGFLFCRKEEAHTRQGVCFLFNKIPIKKRIAAGSRSAIPSTITHR